VKVIVGLGNPGAKYAGTRHNVGFMAAERLAKRWKVPLKQEACETVFGEGEFSGRAVTVAMPRTFMNASGRAVSCLLRRRSLKPDSVLVLCDDVALPLGMIRLRGSGSPGGHMGLASILEELGTNKFARLRIGVRPAGELEKNLTLFVLGKFEAPEEKLLEQTLAWVVEAGELWISRGLSAAMNRFNQKIKEGE
jgi:PTH1 family peptidyl-tRNA hydrolase